MSVLFIDAAFREGSRTKQLAEHYLKRFGNNVERVDLGSVNLQPLNGTRLSVYNKAVERHDFSDAMFDAAKQFCAADEIVIAAPFWNYTLPAVLHDYLELVCTQGISFDMGMDGQYHTLCKAGKLTFIITAGGPIPEQNHAIGYIASLCKVFWQIEDFSCYKLDCLDLPDTDVETAVGEIVALMDSEA